MHYANKCNNYRIYTCTVYLTSTFNENSEISRFKHVIEIHKRREGCAYRNKAGKTEDPEGGGEGGMRRTGNQVGESVGKLTYLRDGVDSGC